MFCKKFGLTDMKMENLNTLLQNLIHNDYFFVSSHGGAMAEAQQAWVRSHAIAFGTFDGHNKSDTAFFLEQYEFSSHYSYNNAPYSYFIHLY